MHPEKYDSVYMDSADLWKDKSHCPRTKVGCVIVPTSGMVATGFNGHASGGPNDWDFKEGGDPEVVHAELNALGKMLEQGVSAKGATVYLTVSPCLECAKLLVRAGVSRVVYKTAYRCTQGLDYLMKYEVKVQRYHPFGLTFTVARDVAIASHGDQRYGKQPYVHHLDAVVARVNVLYEKSPELTALRCIAILHDIIEDTDMTEDQLQEYFGHWCSESVAALSKVEGEDYSDYIVKVRANSLALKVKIADTLCNLEQSLKEKNTRRILKYTKQLELLSK